MIKVIPLGGLDEIGANCTVYLSDYGCICVDFGIKLEDISIKNPFGSLIPSHFILAKLINLSYIIITHVHEDHIGALRYLKHYIQSKIISSDVKIISTKFNIEIISRKTKLNSSFFIIAEKYKWYVDSSNIQYMFLGINHSVPDSHCILIKYQNNMILHTGDWRLDLDPILEPNYFPLLVQHVTLERQKCHLTILSDSTNAHVDNKSTISEKEIMHNIYNVIQNSIQNNKKIFITFFASNVTRFISCMKACINLGLYVSVLSKSMLMFLDIAIKNNMIGSSIKKNIITDNNYSNNTVYFLSGTQGESNSYIYKVVDNEVKNVSFDINSVLIYSANAIPSRLESVYEMKSKLSYLGTHIISTPNLHSSGHAYPNDIKQMYNDLKPNLVIPVHGTGYQMFANHNLAISNNIESKMMKNGELLLLNEFESLVEKYANNIKSVFIYNNFISDHSHLYVTKRRMMLNGVLIIIITNKKDVIIDPIGFKITTKNYDMLHYFVIKNINIITTKLLYTFVKTEKIISSLPVIKIHNSLICSLNHQSEVL